MVPGRPRKKKRAGDLLRIIVPFTSEFAHQVRGFHLIVGIGGCLMTESQRPDKESSLAWLLSLWNSYKISVTQVGHRVLSLWAVLIFARRKSCLLNWREDTPLPSLPRLPPPPPHPPSPQTNKKTTTTTHTHTQNNNLKKEKEKSAGKRRKRKEENVVLVGKDTKKKERKTEGLNKRKRHDLGESEKERKDTN